MVGLTLEELQCLKRLLRVGETVRIHQPLSLLIPKERQEKRYKRYRVQKTYENCVLLIRQHPNGYVEKICLDYADFYLRVNPDWYQEMVKSRGEYSYDVQNSFDGE